MSKEDEEILNFYGGQLEIIREINRKLTVDNNVLIDLNKSRRRENGILICLVISMALWIATG